MASVVSVLLAKGVEGAVSLTGVGWFEVFSMDDCSLAVSERTSFHEWLYNFLYQHRDIDAGYWCAQASPCTARIAPAPTRACGYAMSRSLFCTAIVSVPTPCDRVVRPQVDRCFGILVFYQEKTKHKSFLLVTVLVTWLVCLPIMLMCYYACANSY